MCRYKDFYWQGFIQNLFLGIEYVRFGNSVLDWEIFQITKNVRADQSEEFGN